MKKLFVGIVLTILLAAAVFVVMEHTLASAIAPQEAPVQSFDDVPPEHWAYDEIELIESYGITVGCSYEPPKYCPERAATRAELAVMLARVMELGD